MTRYSVNSTPKVGERNERGSLARAIKNSERFRWQFVKKKSKHMNELSAALAEAEAEWEGPTKTPDGRHAVSSSPQRFDSHMEVLRLLVLSFGGVIEFLVDVVAESTDGSDLWAQELLDMFVTEGFEAALAGIVEFLQICREYVHRAEGHISQSNLLTVARDKRSLEKKLHHMFYDAGGGVPMCVAARYSRGYYALLQQQLQCMQDSTDGKIMFTTGVGRVAYHRQKKTLDVEARETANVMQEMQKIATVFQQLNTSDQELGLSLHPFDVKSWQAEGADADLVETLRVFAEVAEVKPKSLAEDVMSLRPYVLREVEAGLDVLEAWKKAACHYADRAPALIQSLPAMCAIYRGTGPLESRFHIGAVNAAKSSISDAQLQHRMRLWINGPSVEEFCSKKLVDGKVVYKPGPLCLLAQVLYAKEYGKMQFHAQSDPKQHDQHWATMVGEWFAHIFQSLA